MFNNGFVFGKFYPLHKGHLALIEFALTQCRYLHIVVCGSDKELIPSSRRASWIKESLTDNKNINVIEYEYCEQELPNTSVASRDVSAIWSAVFKKLLPEVELVVTSEPYGDLVAEYMQIKHALFDPERNRHSVSASAIREDILYRWDYLPTPVQRYFQRTVSICGTESTGKTILAAHLAAQFPATVVNEAARELIPDSKEFSFDDLLCVALEHAAQIELARNTATPLIVLDTDVYITQSYARYKFNKTLRLSNSIYQSNIPDLRLYLDANVPFVQDGTRLPEAERNQLDVSHRETLADFQQNYTEIIGGDWLVRSQNARQPVAALFHFSW